MSPSKFSLGLFDHFTLFERDPNASVCHFCLKLMATRSVVDSKRLIYRDHLAGERGAGSPGSDGASPYIAFSAWRVVLTKLPFVFVNVLASAIRARALIVLRSAQSIRSGGWRPALDRYPHENIHETRPDRASAGHAQIARPIRGRGADRPDSSGRCSRAAAKVPGKPAGASALFPNQPGIRP